MNIPFVIYRCGNLVSVPSILHPNFSRNGVLGPYGATVQRAIYSWSIAGRISSVHSPINSTRDMTMEARTLSGP
jgi:hypothetical protein